MGALLGILPSLVQLAEVLFPKGSGGQSTGPEKKSFVLRILEVLYDEAASRGKLPPFIASLPRDLVMNVLDALIEGAVKALKGAA